MSHRPPAYPIPRGVISKPGGWNREFGQNFGGGSKWAYRTPRFPDGLRDTDFQSLQPDIQIETAECWFLLNYRPTVSTNKSSVGLPMHLPGPIGGPGSHYSGANYRHCSNILEVEFGETPTSGTLLPLIQELRQIADLWEPIPDELPGELPATSDDRQVLLDAVNARLERIERLLDGLAGNYGGMGHNHGPALDDQLRNDLRADAEVTKNVLASATPSPAAVEDARSRWRKILVPLSERILQGWTFEAGKRAYGPSIVVAHLVFHYACEIGVLLGQLLFPPAV